MTRPGDDRRELLWSAALFALALLPRLYVALAWAREPVWDGHYYHFGATRIAAGLGYSDDATIGGVVRWHPWCHYPVGYSALLALVYRVFGAGLHVGPVTNALLGAACAVLAHQLALRALSPRRARLAGAIVASSPELIAYAALLMTEPAASLAPLGAALVVASQLSRRPLVGAAGAGVILGLGTLIRPQTVLGAPGLLLLALDPGALRASLPRALRVAAVATAACLLTVLPWTVRNCRVMDGCAFVSTNAGWNLAIGAFPRATGRFETLRAADGCPVVTGQVQQDRCWARVGLDHIRAEPARWLALIPKKLSNTYDHASFPMGYLGEANRSLFPEETRARGRALLTAAHRALLVAASLASVAAFWRLQGRARRVQASLLAALVLLVLHLALRDAPSPFWWLAALTPLLACLPLPGAPLLGGPLRYLMFTYASLSVTHAVFFGEDRYHVFLTPALAILAAAALRAPGGGVPQEEENKPSITSSNAP